MSSKFICDGCNRVFDRSELAGQTNVKMHGKLYGETVITLLYCRECWEKRRKQSERIKMLQELQPLCKIEGWRAVLHLRRFHTIGVSGAVL